jgi:hypothetical protein
MDRHEEQPTVAQRRTGFNGIPEPEDLDEDVAREVLGTNPLSSRLPAGGGLTVAAWAALAAVVVPALFAIRAMLRTSRRHRDTGDGRLSAARRVAFDTDITPPHGDKLLSGPTAR